MGSEKWDFDKEAASWDENPRRVKLASDIAEAISKQNILAPDMDVLDFGCGTGLLALRLRPLVHSVTGMDSSQGMLDVLQKKIEAQNMTGIKTQYLDFERGDDVKGAYDLIVCSMTLHHVRKIGPLLDRFHKVTSRISLHCRSGSRCRSVSR
jgi:2-polyprenyl-3-methyl-5-hydroxy-6-metoxy-1,4-benzoquinol methylase